MGSVSTRDNRVFNGPLGRSLRSFTRTSHSAHSLRSAPLRFAPLSSIARSIHGLTHSHHSLPRGTVEIREYVFTLKTSSTGTIDIFVISRNTPMISVKCMFPGITTITISLVNGVYSAYTYS